jgi:alcohol dehydrogenase (cytochrome c)
MAALAVLAVVLQTAGGQTSDELLNPDPADWPTYGRNMEMWRYSPLEYIDRDNVGNLRMTWSRSLGFASDAQFSPSVYDGVMYINGADRVMALDAATGDMIWEYLVELDENTNPLTRDRSRGSVVVFEGKVFQALGDGRAVALDSLTGEELWSSQVGNISVAEGFTSGPIFANGKIILGPSGGDTGGSPGRILALDTENGEILWTFHTVPQPGEPGFETWEPPSTALWGGGSAWAPGAYDPESDTVIYGVGQPVPGWAGDQRSGDNLYTASWVALDADSGELKWHHQVIPRDEWELDQIATPVIADLDFNGETIRTAILATVTGFIVLINVETGEFLDHHAMMPDQENYTVHTGYEDDGTPIIDGSYRYTQPGQAQLVCPMRWVDFEPAAYSPGTGLYYRPNSLDCQTLANSPRPEGWQPGETPVNATFQGHPDMFDHLGALSAIDPVSGEVVWEYTTGYAQRGGAFATASNLVFSGFPDRGFRAFDAETGELLWEQILTAYISSNPITYAVGDRQYVAVAVGGPGGLVLHRRSDVPPLVTSDVAIFVFSLPAQ